MLVFGGVTLPTKQGEMGTSDKEIGEMGTFQEDPKMFVYFRFANHFSFSRCCILFETDLAPKNWGRRGAVMENNGRTTLRFVV